MERIGLISKISCQVTRQTMIDESIATKFKADEQKNLEKEQQHYRDVLRNY